MAPLPEYDTYLSLHFPSLAVFLSTDSHLSTVSSTAQTSSSLLISIKVTTDELSPWTSACQTFQQGTSSSSSSSSSTSSPLPPPSSPSSLWLPLERSLASIYSAATREFLKSGRVLAKVDVVVDQLRTISICPPSSAKSVKWVYSSDHPADLEQFKIAASGKEKERGSYEVVALGGTFDHLHAGHKILLTMACSIATRKVIVGVSDDELLGKKKWREHLEGIDERIRNVERFIELVRPGIQHQVVPLKDVYGPTATDPDIQALVVSEETRSGGDAINKLRSEKSLSTLTTYVINLVSDDGSTTSTTTTTNGSNGKAVAKDDEVKVAVETKMGSTGIREWISRQQTREREMEGNGDKSFS